MGIESMQLRVTRAEEDGETLFAEQAPRFDVTLENGGADAVEVMSLSGNLFTPVMRLLDEAGAILAEHTTVHLGARMVGDISAVVAGHQAQREVFAPGQAASSRVNLWAFGDPLPPGRYAFEAVHQIEAGRQLTSNRLPFEIVPARAGRVALGYESAVRMASLLTWVAEAAGETRLLVRLSGFNSHAKIQQGALAYGGVTADAHIAVGQVAADGVCSWLGWVAVTEGAQAWLLHHNMATEAWRSPTLALGAEVVPVPRFPDREHAVFLAWSADPPALHGALVRAGDTVVAPWRVPLGAPPTLAACAFALAGPIALLFVHDDGARTRVTRIDVAEDGSVITPERTIGETALAVIALAADIRPKHEPSFVLVAADRDASDHLSVARLALDAVALELPPPAPMAGWPDEAGPHGRRAIAAREASIEVSRDGALWLLVRDGRDRVFAGRLEGALVRHYEDQPVSGAHLAGLQQVAIGAFDERGLLAVEG
jgi:hypothetical protein